MSAQNLKPIKKVGVVGAGVMGIGVAQDLAQTGHEVILLDVSEAVLDAARKKIAQNVRLQILFSSGKSNDDLETILGRILFTTDYQDLAQIDFVIENVTEKLEVKKPVYEQLDKICAEHCIFAADTSAIPIALLASFTGRPEKVIGMHFMNPVPLKPVVEVIRSEETNEETIETAMHLLSQMDKEGILVNDAPGFVSNRVLMLTINEAICLVEEGVASPLEVDQIFKRCFGHKMGPLETGDLIGLDTILLTLRVLQESLDDLKFTPSALLVKMVDDGLFGQKSGQGFYTYSGSF